MTVAAATQLEINALHFAGQCGDGGDLTALIKAFQTMIAQYGFTVSAAGAWIGLGHEREYRFYFNTWPAEWLEIYNRENLFVDDPIVAEARRSMKPFIWTELRDRTAAQGGSRRTFELGEAYGWREVFAVPIHGPSGYEGLISMAAIQPVTLPAATKASLEMMALALHRRCRETPGFGTGPLPNLTARQIACLNWVLSGKSDAEIGAILGIAKTTAHFHIEAAKKKLGVKSRLQAVARLVLAGIL